jgi:uncharacterized protein YbjT (DUF2867 family)
MMPPIMAPSPDYREAKAVIAGYKEALSKVPPPKVVALSSIGSEKTSGLGAVNSTHLLEEALRDASFPIAFIRAGAFYENFPYGLQTGEQGVLPLFYSPTDRKLPMIATADIGSEVANLLTSAWDGKLYVELGSMVSPDEMAVQLGEVLGREVKAQAIPRDTWVAALGQVGVPEDSTWAYEEMIEGVNSGWIDFGAEGARRVEGRTTAKQVFLAEKN